MAPRIADVYDTAYAGTDEHDPKRRKAGEGKGKGQNPRYADYLQRLRLLLEISAVNSFFDMDTDTPLDIKSMIQEFSTMKNSELETHLQSLLIDKANMDGSTVSSRIKKLEGKYPEKDILHYMDYLKDVPVPSERDESMDEDSYKYIIMSLAKGYHLMDP